MYNHFENAQYRGLVESSFKRAVEIYQDSDTYHSANPEPVIQVSVLEQDGYTWIVSSLHPDGITQILATVDTLRGFALKGLHGRRHEPFDEGVPS